MIENFVILTTLECVQVESNVVGHPYHPISISHGLSTIFHLRSSIFLLDSNDVLVYMNVGSLHIVFHLCFDASEALVLSPL